MQQLSIRNELVMDMPCTPTSCQVVKHQYGGVLLVQHVKVQRQNMSQKGSGARAACGMQHSKQQTHCRPTAIGNGAKAQDAYTGAAARLPALAPPPRSQAGPAAACPEHCSPDLAAQQSQCQGRFCKQAQQQYRLMIVSALCTWVVRTCIQLAHARKEKGLLQWLTQKYWAGTLLNQSNMPLPQRLRQAMQLDSMRQLCDHAQLQRLQKQRHVAMQLGACTL